jgi:hypothetical protein
MLSIHCVTPGHKGRWRFRLGDPEKKGRRSRFFQHAEPSSLLLLFKFSMLAISLLAEKFGPFDNSPVLQA